MAHFSSTVSQRHQIARCLCNTATLAFDEELHPAVRPAEAALRAALEQHDRLHDAPLLEAKTALDAALQGAELLRGVERALGADVEIGWIPPALRDGEHDAASDVKLFGDAHGTAITRLTPYLLLGDHEHAANSTMLRKVGVTHVVSIVAPGEELAEPSGFVRHKIELSGGGGGDYDSRNLRPHLRRAVGFVLRAIEAECTVLLHCAACASDSPTLAAAVLMKLGQLAAAPALELVRSLRPSADPGPRMATQLEAWALEIEVEGTDEGSALRQRAMARLSRKLAMSEHEAAAGNSSAQLHTYDAGASVEQQLQQQQLNATVIGLTGGLRGAVLDGGGDGGSAAGRGDAFASLHEAARTGDAEGVARILHARAQSVDERDSEQRTALHVAASQTLAETSKIVRILLDGRSDLGARDHGGHTALACACASGTVDSVQQLLKAGSEPFVKNVQGWSARDLACRRGELAVARFLERQEAGAKCLEFGFMDAELAMGRLRKVEAEAATLRKELLRERALRKAADTRGAMAEDKLVQWRTGYKKLAQDTASGHHHKAHTVGEM